MENGTSLKQAVFLVVFAVFTLLCWCPIGYGAYGAPTLILGMPSWAVAALAIGAVMFMIEVGLPVWEQVVPGRRSTARHRPKHQIGHSINPHLNL